MAQTSKRERVIRPVEEAQLPAKPKADTKDPKVAKASVPRKATPPARVKIIWEVCSPTGIVIASFAYPDRVEAVAKAAALSKSKGSPHAVRSTKVPME